MHSMLLFTSLVVMSTRHLVSAKKVLTPEMIANWTSCEEFVNNTKLGLDKLVDITWKIFFFWSPEEEISYDVTFTRPSSVLIDRFRAEFEDLQPPANWSNAELFMEASIDFNALFLRTSTPGIFDVIPTLAFEYQVPKLRLTVGLKLAGPYLGLSNCKYRVCYALAPIDMMPHHSELVKAASSLKFYNPYNRTHLVSRQPRSYVVAERLPDDETIIDEDVDDDINDLDMF